MSGSQEIGSGSGSGRIKGDVANVPKLRGPNFPIWRDMMTKILRLRGLSKVLEDGPLNPDEDDEASILAMGTMDEQHQTRVRACKTTKEIFERLAVTYADESAANKYRLLHEYFRYKKTSDGMGEHIGKMESMRMALADIGEKQSDALFMVVLIGSLPAEYEGMLEKWEMMHESQRTIPILVSLLLKKEKDLQGKLDHETVLMIGKKKLDFKNLTIEEKKKLTRCNICRKKGHWAYECPDKEPKDENGKPRANVIFVLATLDQRVKDKWVADTGATSHICHHKEWFKNLEIFDKPEKCAVGDGYEVEVIGSGQIEIEMENGKEVTTGTLDKVLYVPSIAANLISIGAATDRGIIAKFGKDECELIKDEKVIGKGRRLAEKLYLMDMRVKKDNQATALFFENNQKPK